MGHRITGASRTRGIRWERLHVAIDDASRLAYTEMLANARQETTCAFTAPAIAYFERHGVIVARRMSMSS